MVFAFFLTTISTGKPETECLFTTPLIVSAMVKLATFSYDEEDETYLNEAKLIARRESTSKSAVIMEAVKTYVQNHKEGNAQITMEVAARPGFEGALPTMGEPLTVKFANMSDDDLILLAKAARGRSQEINRELRKRFGPDFVFEWGL
jgi:hypothetical protein